MLWGYDIVDAHAAYRTVQWRNFHVWGTFPLWDPTTFAGRSIVGDSLSGLLNPLGAIFWLSPSPRLFGYYLLAWISLSAWGMYLYARLKGCGRTGGVFAACAFAFSGKASAHVLAGHVELLTAALCLPWLMWGLERLLRKRDLLHAGLLAVLLFLASTCGSIQILYWHFLFLGFYTLGTGLATEAAEGRWRRYAGNVGLLAASVALYIPLGAAWWFPVVRQTLSLSNRLGSVDYLFSASYSIAPKELLRLVWPYAGTPSPDRAGPGLDSLNELWETASFQGVTVLVLAAASLVVFRRRREVLALGLFVVILLGVALGEHTLLHPLACELIPGFSLFRAPGRLAFYVNFLLALLAGKVLSGDRGNGRLTAVGAMTGLGLLASVLGTILLPRLDAEPATGLWVPVLVLLAPAVALALGWKKRNFSGLWTYSFLGMLLVELIWVWNGHLRTADPGKALPESPAGLYLSRQRPHETFRYYDSGRVMKPWHAAHYGLELFGGYHPGMYRHFVDLYSRIWIHDEPGPAVLQAHDPSEAACPVVLDLMNVRYVVTKHPLSLPGYIEVFSVSPEEGGSTQYVYRRPSAMPRAWVVGRAETPPPGTTVLEALCTVDPRRKCLVEDAPLFGSAAYQELLGFWNGPADVTFTFQTEGKGVAILSQAWHPDWRAFDKGRPVPVRRVNHGMIGVPIEAGTHSLRLYYSPWDFYLGMTVSALSALGLLLALLLRRRSRLRTTSAISVRDLPTQISRVKRSEEDARLQMARMVSETDDE